MIHRQNWLDVRAYLRHIEKVKQNSPETVKRARSHLRHLLEWMDETSFSKVRNMDPTFPQYLLTARADGKDKNLAPASIIKCLTNCRQFFDFARKEWSLRYRNISESWIDSLRPPRHIKENAHLAPPQYYSLEDVLKIAAVSTATLRQERGKVAVCMLFLSSMRGDALASIPTFCVDLINNEIHQFPEHGVRTKNRKADITYLLPIPELLAVVTSWHQRVSALPSESLWYATLSEDGMRVTSTTTAYEGRVDVVERDVKIICELAGVPYLSPRHLRNGSIVYARSLARTPEEVKAVSQNSMHSTTFITDQLYARLKGHRVSSIIKTLGKKPINDDIDKSEILKIIEELKSKLQSA